MNNKCMHKTSSHEADMLKTAARRWVKAVLSNTISKAAKEKLLAPDAIGGKDFAKKLIRGMSRGNKAMIKKEGLRIVQNGTLGSVSKKFGIRAGGRYDKDGGVIEIKKDLDPQQKITLLRHEINEARAHRHSPSSLFAGFQTDLKNKKRQLLFRHASPWVVRQDMETDILTSNANTLKRREDYRILSNLSGMKKVEKGDAKSVLLAASPKAKGVIATVIDDASLRDTKKYNSLGRIPHIPHGRIEMPRISVGATKPTVVSQRGYFPSKYI